MSVISQSLRAALKRVSKGSAPVASLVRLFARERTGNVAVLFALASVPLIAFTGAAIDYGFATRLQVKLQAANDATALSLCQTPNATTTPVLQTQALATMVGYMGTSNSLVVDSLVITSNPRKIALTSHASLINFFGNFLGRAGSSVTAKTQCGTPVPKTFEIALVLDNTGSMTESSGSQTKMQAVQTAASNFVTYVYTNSAFAPNSRISIVPFAATVKLDPTAYATAPWVDTLGVSAYHWTNVDKTQANALGFTSRLSIFNSLKAVDPSWGWGGCFEALPYPQNVQDGTPTNNNSLYVPLFAPDEPGGGSSGYATFGSFYNPNYSFNSYIDDSNGSRNCSASPSTFAAAENQACKYVSPKNAQVTTYNAYTGIPNGPNFQCVSKPLQRLTSNQSTLQTLISNLTAAGSTNIHEGLMWGWRTLSPISVFADGAAYSLTTTNKVLILMTDGANSWPDNPYLNYNQTQYFSEGYVLNADGSNPSPHLPPSQPYATTSDERNALDALTLSGCTNAKAAGISIYTIGFSVPSDPIDTQGISMLQSCASNANQAYVANDSNSLISAFNQIATSIGALRLTQ